MKSLDVNLIHNVPPIWAQILQVNSGGDSPEGPLALQANEITFMYK